MKKMIYLIAISIIIFVFNVHGFYVSNQGCIAFPNQCEDGKNESTSTLGYLIIEAGGYYLQSHSDYKYYLKKVELSGINGIDYGDLVKILNNSIYSIENANSIYFRIWEISQTTEYNPYIIEKLKKFDYGGYQSNNSLLPVPFKIVENYLKKGDVRGLFQKIYIDSGSILEKLKNIKKKIDDYTMPDVSNMWRLNQSFIEFDLLGQYSSEVFMNLENLP